MNPEKMDDLIHDLFCFTREESRVYLSSCIYYRLSNREL